MVVWLELMLNDDEGDDDDSDDNWDTKVTTTCTGQVIKCLQWFVKTSVVAALQNCFLHFEEYDENEALMTKVANIVVDEITSIGSGLGVGFDNIAEICVMKYEESSNGPDGMAWEAEVEKEKW